MIEGDIKGFFDNVDHEILIKLLEKRIRDQQLVDLIRKLIKAGYVERGVKRDSIVGTPQGGVLSPILSNIYLHEFDVFMKEIMEKYSTREDNISKANPEYYRMSRRIQYLRDKYHIMDRPEGVKEELKNLLNKRRETPSTIATGERIRYVRYADD